MSTLDNIRDLVGSYGPWTYGIMFAIIFAETGLVIMPFLPGDTLLFAAGLVSEEHGLNIWLVLLTLTVAPICGDNVNYFFGKWLGPRLFRKDNSKIFKKQNLEKTHQFYEKYGPVAVILARWVPVVRTFSPFVAGMGAMSYLRFLRFSVIGAILWVWTLVWAGYFLGNIRWVNQNFEWVMILMIVFTGGPILIEILKHRYQSRKKAAKESASKSEVTPSVGDIPG
jgi:membrane-associated protein